MKFVNIDALVVEPRRDMNRLPRIAEELMRLITTESFSLTSLTQSQSVYKSRTVRRVILHLLLKGKLRRLPAGLYQKVSA